MGGGTGWRRAFCTTIPRDPEISTTIPDKQSPSPSPSPRIKTKFGFLSGGASNPSTPRLQSQQQQEEVSSGANLRCRTTPNITPQAAQDSPKLQCKTTTCSSIKSPRFFNSSSNPSSPSRFSLFKSSLRLSRTSCAICMQNVKTGQGTAIFTAECSHAFHFPCIAAHVRKHANLVCPVCNTNWKEVPLLAIHKNPLTPTPPSPKPSKTAENEDIIIKREVKPNLPVKSKPIIDNPQRLYDDDEPLLSPTAASTARFNPIPEAEEEEEEEDEIQEFQGFFVNPNPSFSSVKSSSDQQDFNGGDEFRSSSSSSKTKNGVEVKLLPVSSALVSVGKNHETYVVAVRVKAPPPPRPTTTSRSNSSRSAQLVETGRRAPIDLVTVLDVSGSMTGAKLQMLKRAMRLLISSLASSDRLSIIVFSSNPRRLLPLTRMTPQGQRSARRLIDRLVCGHGHGHGHGHGQGSSVGDALRKATKVLEDRRERNPVASIMLLSNTHDHSSAPPSSNNTSSSRCTADVVSSSSTRFAHLEIPVHVSGVEDAFAKCVGGLLSVVVQDLRLQIDLSSGSAPAEITAVYSCNGRPTALGSGSIRLGDLYAEEERELLVELRVPMVPVRAHHVISVRCSHKEPSSQELIYGKEETLLVPRPHAVPSTEPNIERLRFVFVTTRAIAEARRLVEQHNDVSSAYRLLASARALLKQSTSISCDDYIYGLESELKELHYRKQQSNTKHSYYYQVQQQQQQQQQQHQIQRRRTVERETSYYDENGEPLTPTSAWRAAEQLAKVAIMRKSMNKVGDLHGFENARF